MFETLSATPHRRYNPLTGEWVLVSPHRLQRPWQGKIEDLPAANRPKYDPACYLCPGNERAGGLRNPNYSSTFVFQNDFAALLPNAPTVQVNAGGLLQAHAERGLCRVICFDPRHDRTLPEMPVEAIRRVVDVWTEQYLELGAQPEIRHVQIFENKGAIMGCSNPHPHGQIWATESVPVEPAREDSCLRAYAVEKNGACLLCDYAAIESEQAERIVCENSSWLAVVPFWAKWPFETLLLSRRHVRHLGDLTEYEKNDLARVLKALLTRYDNLFQVSFPYTMGFHQAPTTGEACGHWHLHGHFYPPLLRSATVQKFMVGFEMLANPQRDITPESAAERLRSLPEVHFREEELELNSGNTGRD